MMRPITRTSQLPQFLRNSKTILRNYGYNFIQDHSTLRPNTLICAMLALVVARIVIAHTSAQHAKGTPDAAFRHREAIQTTFRESAGWVLSYYVLRSIQAATKYALRVVFGIKEDAKGMLKTWAELKEQGSKLWHRASLPVVEKATEALKGGPLDFDFNPQSFGYKHFKGFAKLFSRDESLLAKDMMKNFYDRFPLVVGSLSAVFLSGYVLERFSLKYAPKLIQDLSNWFRNRTAVQQDTLLPTPSVNAFANDIKFHAAQPTSTQNPRYSPFEVTPVQLTGFQPSKPFQPYG